MKWTATIEEDAEGQYIVFPPESLEELGWKEGDTIEWIDNRNGSWTLMKKENTDTELVLVETVSMFRMRYVVEVPKGKSEWALDTVTCNEAKEFSQEHVDENIISHRVITHQEALDLCDVDNDYCKSWSVSKKDDAFITWKKDYEQ